MFEQSDIGAALEQSTTEVDGLELSASRIGNNIIDSDLYLTLWHEDICLAVAGVSEGLDSYYDELLPERETVRYTTARDTARDEMVLTQMQGCKVSMGDFTVRELRRKHPYRDMLMNAWENVLGYLGSELRFVLPAHMNSWMMPSMQEMASQQALQAPDFPCLILNYDKVARRHGFTFDEDAQLYVN